MAPSPLPPPPSPALPLSPSSPSAPSEGEAEGAKLLKVAERMAGLKGLDGEGVPRGATAVGEGKAGPWDFPAPSAVRWLLRSRVVDDLPSALLLCRQLTERGLIQPTRGAAAGGLGGGFFFSPSLLYCFTPSLRWSDAVDEEDVARLRLDVQPHAELIAALCQHYNARERRRSSRGGAADGAGEAKEAMAVEGKGVGAAPVNLSPAASPSGRPRRSSSHRSSVLRDGVFLGVELVRWLRRRGLVDCTRDGLAWGNFLLLRIRLIRFDGFDDEDEGEGKGGEEPTPRHRPSPAGFRAAAVRYALQPLHPHPPSSAAAHALSSALLPLSSPQRKTEGGDSVVSSSAPPQPAVHRLNGASAAVRPVDEPLVSLAELRRRPSFLELVAPLSLASSLSSPSSTGSSASSESPDSSAGSGWEFVQSFGDDASAYDFADADDLVTAVEFDPSGEYLAIGDKAGRVSIVEEADRGGEGGRGGRGSGGALTVPLEYRFYTEFQSHEPEFDSLKSAEIAPRITALEWWKYSGGSAHMTLLTANEKTVKGRTLHPPSRTQAEASS